MRRHVCSFILKDPVGLEKMEAMAQSQRHLSTHIPPSPSARQQPRGSVPMLATAETRRSENRQGLWTSGPVIPFLSSVAVRSCGRQSLACRGFRFPSGGCREGVQRESRAGSFRTQPGSQAPGASPRHPLLGTGHRLPRGASTITSVLQAGNWEGQEAKEVLSYDLLQS